MLRSELKEVENDAKNAEAKLSYEKETMINEGVDLDPSCDFSTIYLTFGCQPLVRKASSQAKK